MANMWLACEGLDSTPYKVDNERNNILSNALYLSCKGCQNIAELGERVHPSKASVPVL